MSQQTVLVVDDEPSICWAFEKMLTSDGHAVVTASSAEEGIRLATEHSPDLVVLDVRLPQEDGISALPKFLRATNNAPVIVMTAFGDLETAVSAVKNGAFDYLIKPVKLEDAARACRSALSKPQEILGRVKNIATKAERSVLVGSSPAMQQVFRQIALVAESDLSVCITGETGTGKELVAAAIHRHSQRANAPYLPIAPVAINPELIESELFGHIKGAFTGATDDRAGLFERAENGTILLDEIGDLPLTTQVKLLRVLEQQQYTRVGDVTPRATNVRMIVATHCDLHEAVERGEFREDLFHRLAGMQIHLPPLRERTEDIRPLCQHFLAAMGYTDTETAVGPSVLSELSRQPWYGNIRELRNAIEHAAVVARGRALSIDDFPPPSPKIIGPKIIGPKTTEPTRVRSSADALVGDASGDFLSRRLAEVIDQWAQQQLGHADPSLQSLHASFLSTIEPPLFAAVLKHTGGNRAKAAEILGIHRGTLRDRLRAYRMEDQ